MPSYTPSNRLTQEAYRHRVYAWLTLGVVAMIALLILSAATGGLFPAIAGLSTFTTTLVGSIASGLGIAGLFAITDTLRGGPLYTDHYVQEGCLSAPPDGRELPSRFGNRWGYFGRLLLASLLVTGIITLAAATLPVLPSAAGGTVFAYLFASANLSIGAQLSLFAMSVFGSLSALHAVGAGLVALSRRFENGWGTFLRRLGKGFSLIGFAVVSLLAFSNIALATASAFGVSALPSSSAALAALSASAKAFFMATLNTLGAASAIYIAIDLGISALAACSAFFNGLIRSRENALNEETTLTSQANTVRAAIPVTMQRPTPKPVQTYYPGKIIQTPSDNRDGIYCAQLTEGPSDSQATTDKGQPLFIKGNEQCVWTHNKQKNQYEHREGAHIPAMPTYYFRKAPSDRRSVDQLGQMTKVTYSAILDPKKPEEVATTADGKKLLCVVEQDKHHVYTRSEDEHHKTVVQLYGPANILFHDKKNSPKQDRANDGTERKNP